MKLLSLPGSMTLASASNRRVRNVPRANRLSHICIYVFVYLHKPTQPPRGGGGLKSICSRQYVRSVVAAAS